MGIRAEVKTGGGWEVPQAGPAIGVIVGVLIAGTQEGYQGGAPRMQAVFEFELHKRRGPLLDTEGRPFVVSSIISMSFNDRSTLCKLATACRGGRTYSPDELAEIRDDGGFDPKSLLGQACRLQVHHKEGKDKDGNATTYANARDFSPLDPDDDTAPDPITDLRYWDWTLGKPIPRRVNWLFSKSAEAASVDLPVEGEEDAGPDPTIHAKARARVGGKAFGGDGGDDIPF